MSFKNPFAALLCAMLSLAISPLSFGQQKTPERQTPATPAGNAAPRAPKPPATDGLVEAGKANSASPGKRAASAPATTAEDDDIVEMSPFLVSTTRDVGYMAQNSLSGSRMNTKLSDIAAPMTIFTEEFLSDMAITDLNELMEFSTNTEIAYTIARVADDDGGTLGTSMRAYRMRGLPGGSPSVNFFTAMLSLNMDAYNVGRIEQTRGPNSILFGLGSPGGLFNVSTKRANLSRSSGQAVATVRSHNSLRMTLDVNEPLVRNKLALRLAGVVEDRNGWRNGDHADNKRIYGTLKWQRVKGLNLTQLNVEGEMGKMITPTILGFVGDDSYSTWVDLGKPLPGSKGETLGLLQAKGMRPIGSITGASPTDRYVLETNTGTVRNLAGLAETDLRMIGATMAASIKDFDLLPIDTNLFGSNFPLTVKYSRASFSLTHSIGRNLNFELAGNYSKIDKTLISPSGRGFRALKIDPNLYLEYPASPADPGVLNPNFDRYYVESTPVRNSAQAKDSAIRGTASYNFTMPGGLGRHTLAGMWESSWSIASADSKVPVILRHGSTPATGQPELPEHATNRLYYRTYLDLDGPVSSLCIGDWSSFDTRYLPTEEGYEISRTQWINRSDDRRYYYYDRYQMNAGMAVLQSRFLDNRLITVVGYRKDRQNTWYSRNSYTVYDSVTGDSMEVQLRSSTPVPGYRAGEILLERGKVNKPFDANSLTFSTVFHATDWLRLTYNHTSNMALPERGQSRLSWDFDREPPPNPKGLSDDIGFKWDFGQTVYLSAVYFKTSAKNDFGRWNGSFSPNLISNNIWRSLHRAGINPPDGRTYEEHRIYFTGRTMDTHSQGFELDITANPTKNWRLKFNFSDSRVKQKNIGREIIEYFEKWKPFWLEGDNGRAMTLGDDSAGGLASVDDDGNYANRDTVAKVVKYVGEIIHDECILLDGEMPIGQMRRKMGVVSNYSFNRGILKGLGVGGSINYRSAAVTMYDNVNKTLLYGRPITTVDFLASYGGRAGWLAKGVTWRLQLNVRNIANTTEIVPVRTNSEGEIASYYFQTPREFMLTCTINF